MLRPNIHEDDSIFQDESAPKWHPSIKSAPKWLQDESAPKSFDSETFDSETFDSYDDLDTGPPWLWRPSDDDTPGAELKALALRRSYRMQPIRETNRMPAITVAPIRDEEPKDPADTQMASLAEIEVLGLEPPNNFKGPGVSKFLRIMSELHGQDPEDTQMAMVSEIRALGLEPPKRPGPWWCADNSKRRRLMACPKLGS